MLIVLGGNPGSGRRTLAARIAAKLSYGYCTAESYKAPIFARKNDGTFIERRRGPVGDTQRTRLYSRITEDLRLLAKMHDGVVVEAPFAQRRDRSAFMTEAKKLFDTSVFVWVDADMKDIVHRLEASVARGEMRDVAQGLAFGSRTEEPSSDEGFTRFLAGPDLAVDSERLLSLIMGASLDKRT